MQHTIASLARFAFVAALVLPSGSAVADDLSAPSGLSVTVQSPNEIRLSWYSSSGASAYVVYRDNDGSGYSFREVQTTYSTSFSDRDVKPGHTYAYVVKAKKDSALSAASSQVKATTPPDAPSGLSASLESNGAAVKLSWSSVSGVSSYVVLRSTDSGGYSYREIGTSYAWSYTDHDVRPGTAYYYVVKAKTDNGTLSAASKQASVVPPLPAPQNVSADASSPTEIRLHWDSVSGADAYVIRRDTDAGGYSYREVGTSYSWSYTDSGLEPGKTYYYVIEAKSSISKSAPSRQVKATTKPKS